MSEDKITKYLINHEIDRGLKGQYDKLAKKFGVSAEAIRSRYRKLRSKGLVEPENHIPTIVNSRQPMQKQSKKPVMTFKEMESIFDELNQKNDMLSNFDLNFNLPEAEPNDNKEIIHPLSGDEKTLVISDLHIPYHNADAIKVALKHGMEEEVDNIIINGDFVDFYGISRFSKKPNKMIVIKEIEMGKRVLELIRGIYPKATIYFKEGNHDARLDAFVATSAPQLYGIEEIKLENLLKLNDFGINFIKSLDFLKIGHLHILHGHEANLFPYGVNVARSMHGKTLANTVFGHFHRTDNAVAKDIEGQLTGAWAVGCLCEMTPDFARLNKWNLGYMIINSKSNGNFKINNIMLDNNLEQY